MGGGGKIMAGRGWWGQRYGWAWVVAGGGVEIMAGGGGGGKIMAGRGWSGVVVTKLWLVLGAVDGCTI